MEFKLSSLFQKRKQWILILLVGILLVVIAVPTKSTKQEHTYPYQEETRTTTEIERKLENLLGNMKSVGKVQVMITYGNDEQVEGIAVLADGAGNGVVVREITSVVQALFDVDSHKIKVIERNQNN